VLLLNLSEEHVDWHGGAERYATDKLKLAELAVQGRIIANFSNTLLAGKLEKFPGVIWFNHDEKWQACGDSV